MNGSPSLTAELLSPQQQGANPARKYYPALDGLRAVAVLLVFAVHYARLPFGWMGVNLFFVLSGFLITGILDDSRDKPHRFRDFYARRTLRIFPLYYGLWFALLLAQPLLRIQWSAENFLWPLYLGNWIPLLSALQPAKTFSLHLLAHPLGARHPLALFVGHFWSLCIEEQFYLVWPLVVYSVRSRATLLRICVATVILCPVLRIAAMHWLPTPFTAGGAVHNFTPFRFDEFLLGGLAALLLRSDYKVHLSKAANALLLTGVAGVVVSCLWGRFLLQPAVPLLGDMHWELSAGITLVDLAAVGLILLCLQERSWLASMMNVGPLRAIGRVSYGFYVFHDLPHNVYGVVNQRLHLQGHGLSLLLPFCGTLALSLLSYHALEMPFLRMKTRFEGQSRTRSAAVAS